jgi:hypothetical protein
MIKEEKTGCRSDPPFSGLPCEELSEVNKALPWSHSSTGGVQYTPLSSSSTFFTACIVAHVYYLSMPENAPTERIVDTPKNHEKREGFEVYKVGERIPNIQFELSITGKRKVYFSSSFGRKRIQLAEGQNPPDLTRSYNVIITRDTKPKDPYQGLYIVELNGVNDAFNEGQGEDGFAAVKKDESPAFKGPEEVSNKIDKRFVQGIEDIAERIRRASVRENFEAISEIGRRAADARAERENDAPRRLFSLPLDTPRSFSNRLLQDIPDSTFQSFQSEGRGEDILSEEEGGVTLGQAINDIQSAKESPEVVARPAIILEGPSPEPRYYEALLRDINRIRSSVPFQVLFDILRADPELWDQYKLVVGRVREFQKDLESPQQYKGNHPDRNEDERHRRLTGMIAALLKNDTTRALLNEVIDLEASTETAQFKEDLFRETYSFVQSSESREMLYIPEAIIGTGPHASIYARTREQFAPERQIVAFEERNRSGGQFAEYQYNVFSLNSRNRPELPEEKHRPGKQNALNTFGPHSVVHPADLSHKTYQGQTVIADSARINMFFAGTAFTGIELVSIKPVSTNENDGLLVEVVDRDPQSPSFEAIETVRIGRLIIAGGLGYERTGFADDDDITQSILDESKFESSVGVLPRVASFTEFTKYLGSEINPYPLKGIKKVVVSGGGDSAYVTIGMILGYEFELGLTSAQLDRVEEVIWIGQDIPSKERFIECNRARYHQIGLEFPREAFENYYHRIKPVSGRSERLLEPTTDPEKKRDRKQIVVSTKEGEKYTGDLVVYCHGFTDRLPDLIQIPSQGEITFTSLEKDKDGRNIIGAKVIAERCLSRVGSRLKFNAMDETGKSGDVLLETKEKFEDGSARYTVTSDDAYDPVTVLIENVSEKSPVTLLIEIRRTLVEKYVDEDPYLSKALDAVLLPQYLQSFYEAPQGRGGFSTQDVYVSSYSKETPVARKVAGLNAFLVGPVAKIPLTAEEIRESPVLGTIEENTAAVFRYADGGSELAKRHAGDLPPETQEGCRTLSTVREPRSENEKKIDLELQEDMSVGNRDLSFTVTLPKDQLPYDADRSSYAKLTLGTLLRQYEVPDGVGEVEFDFGLQIGLDTSETNYGGYTVYEIYVSPNTKPDLTMPKELLDQLERSEQFKKLVVAYLQNDIARSASRRLGAAGLLRSSARLIQNTLSTSLTTENEDSSDRASSQIPRLVASQRTYAKKAQPESIAAKLSFKIPVKDQHFDVGNMRVARRAA